MTSTAAGAPPDVLVEDVPRLSLVQAAASYAATVGAIAAAELQRVRREPSALVTRAAQPLLWLLVFGSALSRARNLTPGGIPYQAFIVPGVLAQSVLFIAIFSGLSIIWERDLGITQRLLVAPVARSAIILGKSVGAGMRALVQVAVVLVAVALVRIHLHWSPLRVVGTLATTVVGAILLSAVSMVIASAVRSREQFMGIGQLITLPLFFASNALYQVSLMPGWLQAAARANPLTYEVEAMRRLLLDVGPNRIAVDLAVLVAGAALAVAVASRLYPRRVM
ncbi:MAG: ABC transporter permease [Actinomycetota bacterium]|nr:ABC transporter permease [Actinomycetota bacterium]